MRKTVYRALSAMLALAVVVSGSLLLRPAALADEETRVVVTSPFTEAVAKVRGSVVGVNNYQTVRYSNFGGSGWSYGWGYGWGDNWGNGRGNDRGDTTQEVKAATGSGVVIAQGYVLTNHHVVEDASSLKIAVMEEGNGEPVEYNATLVASDANLDIAVLYCPSLRVQPVELGDSDSLQVGDWAICIGNPLGDTFFGTVTAGIVSALNRSISSTSYDRYGRRETVTNTMIQVDAAINNGNSGGGMFSVTGELMGIPTLKYSGSAYSGSTIDGIGMCIPINAAKPLINDVLSGVIKTPEVKENADEKEQEREGANLTNKPRLGITIASLNANASAVVTGIIPLGVYVREVESGSPADAAGMKAGDIIVEVDGTLTQSVSTLQNLIAGMNEGDTVNVKVYRAEGMSDAIENGSKVPEDGEYLEMQVTLRIIDSVKQ